MTMQNALYCSQAWKDQERVVHVENLSLQAARELARAHTTLGLTGRIMADSPLDYCEVYTPDGEVRCGTFAETTVVAIRP